jgi:glycogen operon protein
MKETVPASMPDVIEPGQACHPGAHWDGKGVNFALYSSVAEAVELCLFDEQGRETRRLSLPECTDGVWHGYLPHCTPGQRYGYRVQGPWAPESGHRCNPAKLLIDPYARQLDGDFTWSPAVFDFHPDEDDDRWQINPLDSARFVPKCVVTGPAPPSNSRAPRIEWSKVVIYETNVRGYTMRHPEVPEADRGRFRGMANGAILAYLKALGVTSIELMPVHAFIDEQFLVQHGLRNFWGYNTINFFAPAQRYCNTNAITEFSEMVNAIHDAGLEVILDVVYNHTGEGNQNGPNLSFRGIDNLTYYRTEPDDAGTYINDTGCGNTLNVDHPRVQALVLDSLGYWRREMGVDGFRFDLAPVLGRNSHGFDSRHTLLEQIRNHPHLEGARMIAEPWDPGPGGYQLGRFSRRFAEWNDRYRDTVRRFWRGDTGQLSGLAKRLHGSADLFEASGRGAAASINFVTSHDGYTLADLVSYAQRHNHANGEDNRDGHTHNYSSNHGVEGVTKDPEVVQLRRRQRLNLLATLLLSQGTPMLLAGDEFGHSQNGNNNAYAQDNETGWLDWSGLDEDPAFRDSVCELLRLRRQNPLLRQIDYQHGQSLNGSGWREIEWLNRGGERMTQSDWRHAQAITMLLTEPENGVSKKHGSGAVAILLNASGHPQAFTLPGWCRDDDWKVAFTSSDSPPENAATENWLLQDHSMALLVVQAD